MSSHEYEAEISAKEQNIIQLDSKIKEVQRLQKKEVIELKEYISKKQRNDNEFYEENRRLQEELDIRNRKI